MVEIVAAHVERGRVQLRVFFLRQAEPQHIGRSDGAHRGHMFVVGVEDGQAARHQSAYDFRFGLGDAFRRAEFSQMRHAHLEHHGDVRRNQGGEVGDFAHVIGAHFRHQETRAGVHLERRQRQADLIVERSDRSDGVAHFGQQRFEQILGGGFADGTGDADDGERRFQRAPTLDIMLGERSQRLNGVFYDDLRHLRARDFVVDQCGHSPLRADLRHEIMTVDAFAGNRHENGSRHDLARIREGADGHRFVGRHGRRHQPSINRLRDLRQAHRHHGRAAHCRYSSNGWVCV